MDNRTIRNAITKRVPEVYFILPGIRCVDPVTRKPAWMWRMYANVPVRGKGQHLVKLAVTMPDTALVSHKELLNTAVSELYDEVKKIRSGQKSPPMMPNEFDMTPMTDEEKRSLGVFTIEDALLDNPLAIIESNVTLKEPVKLEQPKADGKGKLILDSPTLRANISDKCDDAPTVTSPLRAT